MFFLLIWSFVCAITIVLWLNSKGKSYYDMWESPFLFVAVLILGLTGLMLAIGIPAEHYEHNKAIVKFEQFQKTIEAARERDGGLENAAILMEIAEWNTTLAGWKYDNDSNWFDIFIPDAVDDLEPIK